MDPELLRTDPKAAAAHAAEEIAAASGVPAHDVAVVLGSGWAAAADLLGDEVWSAPAEEISGFTPPALAGHGGRLRSLRTADGTRVLVLGARTHFYEGRGVEATVHGVRTAAAAGVRTLLLTNGCGGLNPAWAPGTAVLIRDHINFTGDTPLRGATFIDMTDVWTPHLRDIARSVAPALDEGVYMQFRGPQYESPAEVRMAGTLGADLVGMSTVLEAIAAREAGLDLLGLSLVTNAAAGITGEPLSHEEVVAAGREAEDRLSDLLVRIVAALPAIPESATAGSAAAGPAAPAARTEADA